MLFIEALLHLYIETHLGAFMVLVQQLVNGMGGAMTIQDFPGPIVEPGLHPLDLGSRQSSEPRAFGKELAQQAIDVLVVPRSLGECGCAT